jgi:hypothetical protein
MAELQASRVKLVIKNPVLTRIYGNLPKTDCQMNEEL